MLFGQWKIIKLGLFVIIQLSKIFKLILIRKKLNIKLVMIMAQQEESLIWV